MMIEAVVLAALCSIADVQVPESGGVGVAAAPRVLSSASGTQGEVRNGRFVILDPRTTFHVPPDAKVIVSFQWLGLPGKHHMTGTWKGPGGMGSTSSFDYHAQDREFGGYWSLPLTADVPEGAWTFEAQVDGAPAGTYEFEIVHGGDGAAAPVPTPAPAPVPLTRQEMFARALAATATVQGLDAEGRSINRGPAAMVDARTFVTAFAIVNNASNLRVQMGTGPALDTSSVVAWDRRRDLAVIRVGGFSGVSAPPPAPLPGVGGACATVGAQTDGAYSVTACEVVGVNDYPEPGKRLSVSLYNGGATPGAPVLDEFGRLVGVVSAGLFPGVDSAVVRMADLTATPSTLVVPLAALAVAPGAPGVPLAELASRGVFVPAVRRSRDVMSGGFAASILRDGARTQPIDQKTEFSITEKAVTTFVNWDPKGKIKSVATVRVYNFDNKQLAETKPQKINLRPGSLVMSAWQFGVPQVEGVYRVDVFLDADIAWRGHFRVAK
jgi:hypothetical protein